MSWPLVALKDCCTIVGGATPKREVEAYWDNQDIPWVTPKDISKIQSIYFDDAPEYISQKGFDSCAAHKLPKGSLLLTSRAPIGNVAITTRELCTNQGFKSLVPKENIDIKYLYFCMLYSADRLENEGNGATFKEVSKKVVEAFKIPLPPLETQKQIAAVLEKADQLRKDCQQMEQELNNLAQSVFIDMFGDPVTNPKGWDVATLGDEIEYIGDIGSNGSNDNVSQNLDMKDEEDYAVMIRTTNLNANDFTNNLKYISERAYNYFSKSKIYGGEIIMNKIGSAGKFWIMPDLQRPVSLGLNQLMIRLKNANTWFIYYYLSTSYGQQLIASKTRGAITKSITKSAVKDIPIIVPPMEKQVEFSLLIEKNNKLLAEQALLRGHYEQSFNALMQKAFKGELNL